MESGVWDFEYFDKWVMLGVGVVGGLKMLFLYVYGVVVLLFVMYNNFVMELNKDDNFFGVIVLFLWVV